MLFLPLFQRSLGWLLRLPGSLSLISYTILIFECSTNPPISSEVIGLVVEAGKLFVRLALCPFSHLQYWFLSAQSISSEVFGSVVEAGWLFLPFLIYGFTFVLVVVISGGGLSMEYVNNDRKWPHVVWWKKQTFKEDSSLNQLAYFSSIFISGKNVVFSVIKCYFITHQALHNFTILLFLRRILWKGIIEY